VVWGDKESEESLAIRYRRGEQERLSLAEFVAKLAKI